MHQQVTPNRSTPQNKGKYDLRKIECTNLIRVNLITAMPSLCCNNRLTFSSPRYNDFLNFISWLTSAGLAGLVPIRQEIFCLNWLFAESPIQFIPHMFNWSNIWRYSRPGRYIYIVMLKISSYHIRNIMRAGVFCSTKPGPLVFRNGMMCGSTFRFMERASVRFPLTTTKSVLLV